MSAPQPRQLYSGLPAARILSNRAEWLPQLGQLMAMVSESPAMPAQNRRNAERRHKVPAPRRLRSSLRQEGIIDRLVSRYQDTAPAENFLRILVQSLSEMTRHKRLIEAKLAQLEARF
jgi:hypothetical protein